MNDPGLDSPISDEARALENQKQSGEQDEVDEDEEAFLAPRCVYSASRHGTRKVNVFSIMASLLP
jgi:hypothetical protein